MPCKINYKYHDLNHYYQATTKETSEGKRREDRLEVSCLLLIQGRSLLTGQDVKGRQTFTFVFFADIELIIQIYLRRAKSTSYICSEAYRNVFMLPDHM